MKIRFAGAVIVVGIILAALSVLADFIGLGDPGGVPAVQILGLLAGVILALVGAGLLIHQRTAEPATDFWSGLPGRILAQPTLLWVLIGFLIAFVLYYILPAFFSPDREFHYFTGYLPDRHPIGFDTRLTLEHVRVWFTGERTPKYIFPPLTTILFAPLLLLRYPANFYVLTGITLVSFFILNLLLPVLINKKQNLSLIVFFFAVSLFSYALQFELESGQFYTVSMMLALAAIYIFHQHPSYRLFAYVLLSVAIQLKIYPAIFVLLLVDDWRDWKTNLKRFALLGVVNFLLLFLLGFGYFSLFMSHLLGSTETTELLLDNHSIYAFVVHLSTTGFDLFGETSLAWMQSNAGLIQTLLFVYIVGCFLVILIRAYRKNIIGINTELLLSSVIVALTLPSINHDYNLTMLTAPFVLFMSNFQAREQRWIQIASIALIIVASFAYSATLFPYIYRPATLQNSFALLFILLTSMTLLGTIRKESVIAICEKLSPVE